METEQFTALLATGAEQHAASTLLGNTLYTVPSSLPKDLTIQLVADGDYDAYLADYTLFTNIITHNLGIRETEVEEFYKTYHAATSIAFNDALLILSRLLQSALFVSGLLSPNHVDGLLCNVTLDAVSNYYAMDWGIRLNRDEPMLTPTRVFSLLKRVAMAWQGLRALNFKVGEDPFFDPEPFLVAMRHYQKYAKLAVTPYLDYLTTKSILEDESMGSFGHHFRRSKTDEYMQGDTSSVEYLLDLHIPSIRYYLHGHNIPGSNIGKLLGKEVGKFIKKGVSGLNKTGEVVSLGVKKGLKVAIPHKGHRGENASPISPEVPWLVKQNSWVATTPSIASDVQVPFRPLAVFQGGAIRSSSTYTDTVSREAPRPFRKRRSRSVGEIKVDHVPAARKRPSLPNLANLDALKIDKIYVVPKLYVSIQELLKKEAQLKVYLAQLQDISNTYEERITTLDAAFDKTEADVNALQKQAQTVLETHRLNMQHVKDTELANDRLEYELTDLEERVRELDMGGMEFDRKVAELNTALPEQDTTTKWTRTIMRLFT